MSYAIYVGKDLTASGHGILAGYGDEPSSHWLEVVPRKHHNLGETITVGATQHADLPGVLSEIPQVETTARHLRVCYSYYKGTPEPLTNGGLNEFGVAVRDVWSPSRTELVATTPTDQTGPNYSDLCKLVLERARTAREGVELMGRLIAKHGHVTYGGNSNMIADAEECWVVIQFAGGQGLWAAERLNGSSIRVSRPGYIGEVPVDGDGGKNYLWSPNLITYAIEQGWYNPTLGVSFDVNAVYGDSKGRWDGVAWVEDELRTLAAEKKLSQSEIIRFLRTAKITGDTAGYSQVVPLYGDVDASLRVMWHAPIGAAVAPLVPVFLGVDSVAEEYRKHRYLSAGESQRFVDGRHAEAVSSVSRGVESTRCAVAVFKRLQYLAFEHPPEFLEEIQKVWTTLEYRLEHLLEDVITLAELAQQSGKYDLATRVMTTFSNGELQHSLDVAEKLVAAIEVRTRILFGFSASGFKGSPEQIW